MSLSFSGYAIDPTAESTGVSKVVGNKTQAEESKGKKIYSWFW